MEEREGSREKSRERMEEEKQDRLLKYCKKTIRVRT